MSSKGRKIGYVRVSTAEQNKGRQIEMLQRFHVHMLFEDSCSAKDTNRPNFKKLMETLTNGDELYICDFSRLSRSVVDLLNILNELKRRGVTVVSLKENLDTATPTGKLMLTMIGAINEFERAVLLERQKEGIALAKAGGAYKGRKPIEKPKDFDSVAERILNKSLTAKEGMVILGMKKTTFYKYFSQYKESKI